MRLVHVFSRIDCLWHWLWISPGVVLATFGGIGLCFGPSIHPASTPGVAPAAAGRLISPASLCCLPPPWTPLAGYGQPGGSVGGGEGAPIARLADVLPAGLPLILDRPGSPTSAGSVREPAEILIFVPAVAGLLAGCWWVRARKPDTSKGIGLLSRRFIVSTGPCLLKRP